MVVVSTNDIGCTNVVTIVKIKNIIDVGMRDCGKILRGMFCSMDDGSSRKFVFTV